VALLAALCHAIDRRPYMHGHGRRVSELAEALACRLGWNDAELRRLRVGARLHDLGKLAIADDVWKKPGRLNDHELAQVRCHPTAGMRLLARLPDFRFAIPLALFHHERWDGRGYPCGRAAEQIPLAARVLAVADAFDAMTSDRSYQSPLALGDALGEIERCAGTQFDPRLARIFVGLWAEEKRAAGASS
jgi:HD-GYP domain-containing protein (c-di-GMP phosphodiesterase class II)